MSLDYGASRIIDNGTTRHVTYTPVKHTELRRGDCPQCGKKSTRSLTFERTVSTFNKRDDGEPKTYAELLNGTSR